MLSHPRNVGDVPLPHYTHLAVARLVQLDAAERLVVVVTGEVLMSFS
ncbi:hypothetical protein J2W92_005184 [Rhizobium leguminosarum]